MQQVGIQKSAVIYRVPGTVTSDMDKMYGAPIHCGALSFTSITFTFTGITKLCNGTNTQQKTNTE